MKRTLGRKPPKVKQRDPKDIRAAENFRSVVYHRAEGRSQLTGAYEYPMDAHHCLPAQFLRRVAPELAWDADNGMLITRREHELHENGGLRITYEQLPEYVLRFAEQHDLMWAIERYYRKREEQAA